MLSYSIIKLLEDSSIDYKPELETQEEDENKKVTSNWIDQGNNYGHEIDLLNMQLRTKPKVDIKAISEKLIDELNIISPSSCDILTSQIFQAYASQKCDECLDWNQFNRIISTLELHANVLYGIALSMIRENNIDGAISSINRLLSDNKYITPDQKYIILTRFLVTFSDLTPIPLEHSSSEEWDKHIHVYLIITKILTSLHKTIDDLKTYPSHKEFIWIVSQLELIKTILRKRPSQITKSTWNSMINLQNYSNDPDAPKMYYVESKSLPRSGHHYLKSIFQSIFKDNFSYCEGYQEPGCCKSSPCSNNSYWNYSLKQNSSHWRLVKSHDFNLTDMTFDPTAGMFRFIQVRRPLDILISWLELQQLAVNKNLLNRHNISLDRIYLYHEPQLIDSSWDIIDNLGTTFSKIDAETWLKSKFNYIVSFSNKWLPLSLPISEKLNSSCGNYVINYTELSDPTRLLSLLGVETYNKADLPSFRPKRPNSFMRKSRKVTELFNNNSQILHELDELLISDFPRLADGSQLSF